MLKIISLKMLIISYFFKPLQQSIDITFTSILFFKSLLCIYTLGETKELKDLLFYLFRI